MKVLDYDLIYNGRDIGGMKTADGRTIKYGRLFRSGELYPHSKIDEETLSSLHLTDVVDFRESASLEFKPDYIMDGVNYHNFPPVNFPASKQGIDDDLMKKVKSVGGGHAFMLYLYKTMFSTKMAIDAYTNFFKVLVESEDKVVLWHCAQGKDRAGMASFFLEYALGVSFEDCVTDYLYSKVAMDKYQAKVLPDVEAYYKDDTEAVNVFKEAYTVKREFLNEAIKYIDDTFGGLDKFLKDIIKVDIDKLRKIYLD
ncbi:MAG: tyrosine-protein phosphatase [Bacilli bacterium]|nr:tyrosine-protein phosphatase [Bacilli bacterium]